ncbi:MAG TPA: ferrous iron transport protein A [Chloroflexi bacterium]|nr:ferrous iron transport protein A [Chloroflexota bacterium]
MSGPATAQGDFRLSDLRSGETGVVLRLEVDGDQRRRLMDLGLIPGTEVTAELVSPLGDPVAYRVRGSLIALRRDQARLIVIRREADREDEE